MRPPQGHQLHHSHSCLASTQPGQEQTHGSAFLLLFTKFLIFKKKHSAHLCKRSWEHADCEAAEPEKGSIWEVSGDSPGPSGFWPAVRFSLFSKMGRLAISSTPQGYTDALCSCRTGEPYKHGTATQAPAVASFHISEPKHP